MILLSLLVGSPTRFLPFKRSGFLKRKRRRKGKENMWNGGRRGRICERRRNKLKGREKKMKGREREKGSGMSSIQVS